MVNTELMKQIQIKRQTLSNLTDEVKKLKRIVSSKEERIIQLEMDILFLEKSSTKNFTKV